MNSPRLGEVIPTIRSLLPSLLPTEKAVAVTLLQHASEVVEWSSQQVADAAGASRATVVRTCQSLGFTGYQQLRVLLARDAGYRARAAATDADPALADPNGASAGSAHSPAAIVAAAFRHVAHSIDGMSALLQDEAVDQAVEKLAGARRVIVVGNGLSAPLAMDAAARMTGIGRAAEAPVDAIYQHISARLLGPCDALLAISASGSSVLTVRAAEAARTAGAAVIVVTAFDRTHLTQVADLALIVTMPDLTFQDEIMLSSRLPQAILIEALIAALTQRLGDTATAAKALAIDAVSDHLTD